MVLLLNATSCVIHRSVGSSMLRPSFHHTLASRTPSSRFFLGQRLRSQRFTSSQTGTRHVYVPWHSQYSSLTTITSYSPSPSFPFLPPRPFPKLSILRLHLPGHLSRHPPPNKHPHRPPPLPFHPFLTSLPPAKRPSHANRKPHHQPPPRPTPPLRS